MRSLRLLAVLFLSALCSLVATPAGTAFLRPAAATAAPLATSAPADFNGDGFSDLAVGVPQEDLGSAPDAGAVNVLYGSPTGLTDAGNQLWSQNSTGIADVGETSDWFGYAEVAGDFDGDGFADLAVGIPYEDVGPAADAGGVNVIYGSAAGLSSAGNQLWTQDTADIADVAESGDLFGGALAAGDVNGDGFADLAIAAPLEDVQSNTKVDAGLVHVILGSASGLTSAGSQTWTQNTAGILDSAESCNQGSELCDLFGSQLGMGNFDGHGFADLAIGVPGENLHQVDAGATQVIYGSSAGLTAAGNQEWSQDSLGVLGVEEAGDASGSAVVAGDFNGDGIDDLATSAQWEDVTVSGHNVPDAGTINVLYGSGTGLTSTGNQYWNEVSLGTGVASCTLGGERCNELGWLLATGDFDGDGFDELAAAIPGENTATGTQDVGAVDVVYGSASGLTAEAAQEWNQNTRAVKDVAEQEDELGVGLTTGEFGNGTQWDLAAGAAFESLGSATFAGAVNVLYGSPEVLSDAGNQFWTQDSGTVADQVESNDSFGFSLGAGEPASSSASARGRGPAG